MQSPEHSLPSNEQMVQTSVLAEKIELVSQTQLSDQLFHIWPRCEQTLTISENEQKSVFIQGESGSIEASILVQRVQTLKQIETSNEVLEQYSTSLLSMAQIRAFAENRPISNTNFLENSNGSSLQRIDEYLLRLRNQSET